MHTKSYSEHRRALSSDKFYLSEFFHNKLRIKDNRLSELVEREFLIRLVDAEDRTTLLSIIPESVRALIYKGPPICVDSNDRDLMKLHGDIEALYAIRVLTEKDE